MTCIYTTSARISRSIAVARTAAAARPIAQVPPSQTPLSDDTLGHPARADLKTDHRLAAIVRTNYG